MIIRIKAVSTFETGNLDNILTQIISKWQNEDNLEIEIQYSMGTDSMQRLVYSALVIGREKKNI